jgi:6-pyruvoyltetrahydropterin/6-carboxytetrahydropterin synthase
MYNLKLKHHFDAAHKLEDYNGPCSNLHGHRWDVLVEISSGILENEMVIDFKKIKEIINILDHLTILQDIESNRKLIDVLNEYNLKVHLVAFNPTAENLAVYLKNLIFRELENVIFDSVKVTLWESPEASITV